jgi:hypothetical protein
MYLAHAGHEHFSEYTDASEDFMFKVAVGLFAAATIAVIIFVYEMRKNSKPKSKRSKSKK